MDGSQEIENGNTRKACFFPEHVLNNPMILALKPSHLSKLSGLQKCSLLTVPKHFQVEMDVSENGIYLQHPPTDHVYYVRKNYDTLW